MDGGTGLAGGALRLTVGAPINGAPRPSEGNGARPASTGTLSRAGAGAVGCSGGASATAS
jgi:hypothetical protein